MTAIAMTQALAQSGAAWLGGAQAPAQSAIAPFGASEITAALRGKICTTPKGARFTFTDDGHYGYEGLWQNKGHYTVNDGSITVVLDSGLERSFAISRSGGGLYLEETAVSCR